MSETEQAWVLRMRTGGGDVVAAGVEQGLLFMGWSNASGLLDCESYDEFRQTVKDVYYGEDSNLRRAGSAARQLWNFAHVIKTGDLVVVPDGPQFYVGQVTGEAMYNPEPDPEDTAYRRPVEWLNGGDPLPRGHAQSRLWSRMKSYRTLTAASDVVDDIYAAFEQHAGGVAGPTFAGALRETLIEAVKQQLQTGLMNERRFEELVCHLFEELGGINSRVVPRRQDIGADIEMDFVVAQMFTVPVRVQAKYWKGEASLAPVEQLLEALNDPSMTDVELGFVVTTAGYDDATRAQIEERAKEAGKQIIPVDGDELARLIVDFGLNRLLAE